LDVTQLPYNRLIGLEPAPTENGFLVSLPGASQYTNHLGTVHAGALLAVAEAGSGAFLLMRLGDSTGFIPVVRRMEAKFRRPATGRVSARAVVASEEVARWKSEMIARGRVLAPVPVEVVDTGGAVVLSATVEWFITRPTPEAETSPTLRDPAAVEPLESISRGSRRKEQVRRFYDVLWNAHDISSASSILHPDVTFRGSLGHEKKGHAGVAEYVDMVHRALGEYRCVIEELLEEGDKVFAKMTFCGIHRGEFLGHLPTHRNVSWTGCALFSFQADRIRDVWVLGDLNSLEVQLQHHEP
jgi:predicted ester cyclase/acyl-coenzyme A thioesterase PaaI-like protein